MLFVCFLFAFCLLCSIFTRSGVNAETQKTHHRSIKGGNRRRRPRMAGRRYMINGIEYEPYGLTFPQCRSKGHSGPELLPRIFVSQFARTRTTARPGPFRSATPLGVLWAGRHGPGQWRLRNNTCLHDLLFPAPTKQHPRGSRQAADKQQTKAPK
jgi:hypothetical protein